MGLRHLNRFPFPVGKRSGFPAGLVFLCVVGFAVVDFSAENWRRIGLPRFVGDHPVYGAVLIGDAHLRSERRWRVTVVVSLSGPHERGGIPAGSEERADRVFARFELRGYVVGLVDDPRAVVGPARSQDLIANRLAIEKEFVRPQRSGVDTRRYDRLFNLECLAKRFY
jgi:hypothetical protein